VTTPARRDDPDRDDPEPGSAPSLARRAAIALVLMAGFYGLAAGMAFALAWIPYATWTYGHRFNLRLAVFCLGGAYLILRAIVPTRDRFEAPGPRLQPERQPRLFAEIRGIAAASGQEMPAEVYLVPDVNAWVAQRGGVMGVGGRRIMGLGLPLLQAVSVAEMRAIVAHEFGHYFGGDVKLGPLIYRTREALVRTVIALHQHSGFLQKPFEWYAALFFRVTHAVSRHQELQADALAARLAGADALARGLRTVHGAGLAFGTYWAQEVAPVLGAGYLPPLAVGFSRFLEQPRVTDVLRAAVETEEREGKADPYDTHPSLRARLAALARRADPPPSARPGDDGRAIDLLDALPEVEKELVALRVAGGDKTGGLKPLEWEKVGGAVHVPLWEEFLRENGSVLAGVTPATLPALDWEALGRKLIDKLGLGEGEPEPPPPLPAAGFAVGAALSVALARRGFAIEAPPGAPVTLVRGPRRIEPFDLRERLGQDAAGWRPMCAVFGFGVLALGAPCGGAAGPPSA
jgi:Zn-dependent protease with chaperone function